MKPRRVVVIGTGVVGFQVATELQKLPVEVEVTLCSVKDEKFDNNGPAMPTFIVPAVVRTDEEEKWLRDSWNYFDKLFLNPSKESNPETNGLFPLPLYQLESNSGFPAEPINRLAQTGVNLLDQVYVKCSRNELSLFGTRWKSGTRVMTYALEPSSYLGWMRRNFDLKGGRSFTFPTAEAFRADFRDTLKNYDVIVNCMGKSEFSALVFDNQINQPPKLAPSVHCIKVKAPGIKFAMLTDEFFIQPAMDYTILGVLEGRRGVAKTPKEILGQISLHLPSLTNAHILEPIVESYTRVAEEDKISPVLSYEDCHLQHCVMKVVHCLPNSKLCYIPGLSMAAASLVHTHMSSKSNL